MEKEIEILNKFQYSKKEWQLIKLFFILFWLLGIIIVSGKYHSQPFPEGICIYFNCSIIHSSVFRTLLLSASILFSILYVMEWKMHFTTFILSSISILVFSLERSNGIYHREELFSLILIAQFFAYLRFFLSKSLIKKDVMPQSMAMFFSISVISGAYMIAGITKLQTSGIYWVTESPNVAIQVLQSMEHKSIDNGIKQLVPYGHWLADFIILFPNLIRLIFAFALVAELMAFLSLLGKKQSKRYGYLLLLLHFGMFLMLFVKLVVFIGCVLIFMVNIPGILINRNQFKNHFFLINTLSQYALVLLPFLFYFSAVQFIGEAHPFSRFPMYSSFPDNADYFYIADDKNNPISTLKVFGITIDQLKDMVEIRASNYKISRSDSIGMKRIASECLKEIIGQNTDIKKKYAEMKWVRHEFFFNQSEIIERKSILAVCKLK
jgi:hypothetical protein